MSSELERIKPYLPLIAEGQRFRLYPDPQGLDRNEFEYVDYNGTHLKIRNVATQTEYYLPFVLMEFINPTPTGGMALIRLTRSVNVHGGSFV